MAEKPSRVYYLNVTQNGQKGDSILVDCDGKYVLIDGGHIDNIDYLVAELEKYCTKKVNNKIVLHTVVITHFHPDHYGGIKKLFYKAQASKIDIQNVWRPNIYGKNKEDKTTYGYKAYNHIRQMEIEGRVIGKPLTPAKEDGKSSVVRIGDAKTGLNDTLIDLYAPAYDFRKNTDAKDVSILNNCSILVRIQSGAYSHILMGDMTYVGMKAAVEEYSQAKYGDKILFKTNYKYNVCKYGHHGLRGFSDDLNQKDSLRDQFPKEIALYNTYIGANVYIFTASKGDVKEDVNNAAKHLAILQDPKVLISKQTEVLNTKSVKYEKKKPVNEMV